MNESLNELRIAKPPKSNKNPKQIEDKKPKKSKITFLPKKVSVPSTQRTLFGYITSKAWSTNAAAQQGTSGIATSSIPLPLLLSESKTMSQSSKETPKSTNSALTFGEGKEELDAHDGAMFIDDVVSRNDDTDDVVASGNDDRDDVVASGNDDPDDVVASWNDDTDDVVGHKYTCDSIRMTFPKDKRYIS